MIEAIIAEQNGIERVFNIITIQYGPDTMLAAKVKIQPGISIEAAVEEINALERKLKARIPNLAWCFIEPDVTD
jgi:divalent metal cation (Fe/Co/Zn/Cd) transporter